jgi:hypothetical protein
MDPYLESSRFFPGLHNKLIAHLEEALQPNLPDPYYADSGERIWVEHREAYLEIFHGRGGERRLVTVIEVLSPANKAPGEHGRDLYLRKQREIMAGQANLVEIDLLRDGVHTTGVPRDHAFELATPFAYHVCVFRFAEANRFYVYPIRLEDALPNIGIPLLPGDADISLDLQRVFDRCYDAGPYRRIVRYQADSPEPPLTPEQQDWALQILSPAK